MLFCLVTYVLPMLGLSTTYCHLCSVLWTRGQPGQPPATQHEHRAENKIKDKRKVSKTFSVHQQHVSVYIMQRRFWFVAPLFLFLRTHDQTPATGVM